MRCDSIGDFAFYLCNNFTRVTFSALIVSIGESAFQYCKSLAEVKIPDSVIRTGEWVLYDGKTDIPKG